MTHLTQLSSWKKLQAHYQLIKFTKITDLFKEDTDRLKQLSFHINDFFVDFSFNRLLSQTKKLLIDLAYQSHLGEAIDNLFSGKAVNFTENRAALHMTLRIPYGNNKMVITQEITEKVITERTRLYDFANKVRDGKVRGKDNKIFRDIVMLGVGGSMLGPQMLYEAFSHESKFNLHFVAGMDGEEIDNLLKKLNPETSLFIIASKSFTTLDTLSNAKTVKKKKKVA